jgi:hypothetical protein
MAKEDPTMARTRRSSRLHALALLLAGMASAASADLLSLEANTNYHPGFDFTVARASVSLGGRVVASHEVPLFIGDPSPFRVADFDLPTGELYDVEIELVHRTGRPLARRRAVVDFRGNRVVTLVFAKPTGTAQKSVALVADNDRDGAVSAGDLLRYTVVVDGDAARFADDPGPGLRLAIGSVTTSFGTVTRGNTGPDFLVVVDGLEGAPGPVTITFDCDVLPVLENQGELELADSSEGTSTFARISIPTDDPSTAVPDDATRTLVTCSGGPQCAADLAACTRDLGSCRTSRERCEQDRQELKDRLTALLTDPDSDGVPAVLDLCPKTSAGAAVDDRGCSQAQFCGRVPVSAPRADAHGRAADWRGAEPLSAPRDCRPGHKGICQPE